MKDVMSHSVDIICSDAVFEHLRHFEVAVKEMTRVLASGGVLYANFGPLWHSWGGDHISGSKDFAQGYNHIDLKKLTNGTSTSLVSSITVSTMEGPGSKTICSLI